MRPIGSSLAEKAIKNYSIDIKRHEQNYKRVLSRLLLTETNPQYCDYIILLEALGNEIITSKPDRINVLKTDFDNIMQLNPNDEADKEFKEKILNALGYTARRSDFYPKYFQSLGIKTCVYCNSQLCVTVEGTTGDLIAKFQVDHFLPKDLYPCFSIALFNLYPVCSSCNNKKGIKLVDFHLYHEVQKNSPSIYSFELDNPSVVVPQYIANRNPKILKVIFNEPAPTAGSEKFDDLFSITGIYNTQIDLVEELIMKKEIYTEAYKGDLLKSFGNLFDNKRELEQLIVGNYIELDQIHKRPMTKFIQDIADQIDLI